MEFISVSPILQIYPNSVEVIRKEYNLHENGRMEQAIDILLEWIQKQPHFKKKDFPRYYLEMSIITCKGSIERSKKQIDAMCTVRTLTPEFFCKSNVKDFQGSLGLGHVVNLPKTTDDLYRISLLKILKSDYTSEELLNTARHSILLSEYTRSVDYIRGFLMVLDMTKINIVEFVKNANLLQIKHTLDVIIGGYGMRLKGIHFITDSKMVDVLITFVKQVVSKKIAGRIHVHKNYEELHKVIPPRILPKDLGGEELGTPDLMDKWIEVLSSEKNVAYFEEMNKAGTDESLRLEKSRFNYEYAGMAGTFRALSVD